MRKYLILVLFSLIIACSGIETKRPEYTAIEENRVARYGEGVLEAEERWRQLFNRMTGNETVTAETVNEILWSTTLDKIAFMPLADVDKLSGIIITEWYSINENQKIKLNIFVKDKKINEESLEVKIFQQSYVDNEWVQIDRNLKLETKIKESILTTDTQEDIQINTPETLQPIDNQITNELSDLKDSGASHFDISPTENQIISPNDVLEIPESYNVSGITTDNYLLGEFDIGEVVNISLPVDNTAVDPFNMGGGGGVS